MAIEFADEKDASDVRQMAITLAVLAASSEDDRIIRRAFETAKEVTELAALIENIEKEKDKDG